MMMKMMNIKENRNMNERKCTCKCGSKSNINEEEFYNRLTTKIYFAEKEIAFQQGRIEAYKEILYKDTLNMLEEKINNE